VPASLRCEIFPVDLDATVDFYVNVLAFDLIRDERTADRPYVALERDDVRLGAAARTDTESRERITEASSTPRTPSR
jgi:catechol 2,3-dioxygenase-like lactoylglutathione lyase family enzyme